MSRTRAEAGGDPGDADASDAEASQAERAHRHRWLILGVLGLAQLMVVLDVTIVNIALPSAQDDLGFDNGDRQWVVTAYSLAFGSLLLLGGRIADLVGRKVTFLVGLVGFATASAVAGASVNFEMLVVARAFQGATGALLAPSALSLLTTTFTDKDERAKAFSVYGAVSGAGGAIGLLLGGLLTEYLDWRWTLYVNVLLAVVAFGFAFVLLIRTARDRSVTLDVPGTALVTAGLFCVVYGFSNAEHQDWGALATWVLLIVGGLLLVAFVRWQERSPHPLLPLRILADRNRGASYLGMLIAAAGMFGVFLFLTYYLQTGIGYTPIESGVAFLPMVGALVFAATLATNVLLPRFGPRLVLPAGMAAATAGLAWMTSLDFNSSYAAHILPMTFVAGLGLGLIVATAMSLGTLGVSVHDAGVASATVNAMQQVGGSIGIALLNTISASAATDYVSGRNPRDPAVRAQAALESYHTAFWWSAGFFAVGAVVTVLLYRSGVPEELKGGAPTIQT
ncbi:MFS transporter [Streptomyces sp. WMMC500]|uniref:MFS transporter n=1 Tax=Streptomyces sp. WMMC500 TaxID=3015154 RepID=UPI00248B8863|nr:MFS transporter [Streptomyces sp. WMMC500]WBB58254.1 MFS transporter [Streptomyces sp. WMMC500]